MPYSSRCSVFSRRKSTFSDYVFSRVAPAYSIYRRTGLLIIDSRRTDLTRAFTYYNSVSLGGELSSSERSSASVESIFYDIVGSGGIGIRRVERIVIGLNSKILVARKHDSIFADVKAISRASIYTVVYSTRGIRLASR